MQRTEVDTYAATLVSKTFRALRAIAAAYDLDCMQYDVINAFTNAVLNEDIYCRNPEGFSRPGEVLHLKRALYGLKQSPLLRLNDFSAALEELGLLPVPGVNCLFTSKHLTVLFYVDDIIVLYAPRHAEHFKELKRGLTASYKVRSLGELKWFLGIRIIRDREFRQLWLCQDAYIDKIAATFNLSDASQRLPTPLSSEDWCRTLRRLHPRQIHAYQQLVGSINFSAVTTRPDISKACSRLAEFLTNPSPTLLISCCNLKTSLL